MSKVSPIRVRMPQDRVRSAPVETKRCKRCRRTLPLTAFDKRKKGGQGVAANCSACQAERYELETFKCRQCGQQKFGTEFFRSSQGQVVRQPCKECISTSLRENRDLARLASGRGRYHKLSHIDEDTRRADCRECGPTHIYSTGQSKGCGWRCGTRGDKMSEEHYQAREDIVGHGRSSTWHRIRNVRGEEMRGTCSLCGDVPVRWNQGGFFTCASPTRQRKHADEERSRRRLVQYGLTDEAYDRMVADQDGLCAICRGEGAIRSDSDGSLVVDHDHAKSGAESVRGLLCGTCNAGLGQFFDNPDLLRSAIDYLVAYRERSSAA